MKWTGLFLMLLCFQLMADSGQKELEGFDASTDGIKDGVIAGPYLMYDCKEAHWLCVVKENFADCVNEREKEKKDGKKRLSCAPLGIFPTKKACLQRQLFMTGQNHGARVCINDAWKQREMR